MKIEAKEADMCPDRLERITHHFNARYIEPGKIPGCQILVVRHGHIAYFRTLGMMDLERQKPMRDDTIFRIFSMTKPIASVALMQLYEQALFQLADPVRRFIPEWQDLQVYVSGTGDDMETEPCQKSMTIRDLLMHMSGLTLGDPGRPTLRPFRISVLDGKTPVMQSRQNGSTLADVVRMLSTRPLMFQPGTHWNYGISTDICGYLVEVISGQRFDQYLAENVFGPLSMKDTGFHVPEDGHHRFPALYTRNPNKTLRLIDDAEQSRYLAPPSYFSGAGGLVSTTEDYSRFCQMLLNGGELDGVRILGRKTIELMSMNHLPGGVDLEAIATGGYAETGFTGVGFGLGFAVTLGDVQTQSIGSNGDYFWGGAANTVFWIDPEEDLYTIFMTQLVPTGIFNFRGQLKNIIYGAIK